MPHIKQRGTIRQCWRRGVPCMSFVFQSDIGLYRVWFEIPPPDGELQVWREIRKFAEAAGRLGADWQQELAGVQGLTTYVEDYKEMPVWG